MKLFEYQSRKLLAEYGVPVPRGEVTADAAEAGKIAGRLAPVNVVKAQVLTGGRGKAGGVRLVKSPEETAKAAADILGMKINGMPVARVLVSEAADIAHEYYVSIVVNRNSKQAECVFSSAGGVDIEEVAASSPEKILRFPIDPVNGIEEVQLRKALDSSFETPVLLAQALSIINNMYRLFTDKDCSLVEVNPLVRTPGDRLIAIDAKIVIDDNALMKHEDLEALRNAEEYSPEEIDARNAGLSFVGLEGAIGCMVNGAGLAMATMDLIKHFGGEPANFLDIGGSSNPQKVVDALGILLRNRNIKAILMNIFGGITRCDDIANGVLIARERIHIPVPFIIRLIGTNDALGRSMLLAQGLHAYNDLTEAVKKVIEASKGGGGK